MDLDWRGLEGGRGKVSIVSPGDTEIWERHETDTKKISLIIHVPISSLGKEVRYSSILPRARPLHNHAGKRKETRARKDTTEVKTCNKSAVVAKTKGQEKDRRLPVGDTSS